MRRWWSVATTLAVALTVTLVWLAVGSPPDGEPTAATEFAGRDDDGDEPGDDPGDRGRELAERHGPPAWAPGPPPWAHGRGGDAQRGDQREWLSRWRDMTPQEREQTMRELARQHAAGMREWSRCVADGRGDCEKPMPPGLAKKQPQG